MLIKMLLTHVNICNYLLLLLALHDYSEENAEYQFSILILIKKYNNYR